MTLGLTPTLGLIGAIIPVLLHVAVSLLLHSLPLLFVPPTLSDEAFKLTASVDINCEFARCFGTGEQLLGDLVADVTVDSCNETSIPWQLLTRPCSLTFSAALLFTLGLSLFLWPPCTTSAYYSPWWSVYVNLSFTPTRRRCVVERCIDCLTEASSFNKKQQKHHTMRSVFSFLLNVVLFAGVEQAELIFYAWTYLVIIQHKHTPHWVCWETSSLHLQLHSLSSLFKCKQTIAAPRHVKFSLTSWDTVGSCNQTTG